MVKYLWVGSYLNDECSRTMNAIGYNNAASIVSQQNYVDGIESILNDSFDIISVLSFNGYPSERIIKLDTYYYNHGQHGKGEIVGFLNLRYINKISSIKATITAVRNWIKNNKKEDIEVFVYELRSVCLAAAKYIKKKIPNSKIHLFVPDLPEFMDLHMSRFKKMLKKIDANIIKRNINYIDYYILYASPMAERLQLNEKKWLCCEGSINVKEIDKIRYITNQNCKRSEKIILMYSGMVNFGYGIQELIDSLGLLNDKFELWITGSGDAKDYVVSESRKNKTIKYYGFLPTRDELLNLQSKSSIFINLRNPKEEASKYCFPSKLFEYLMIGKPIVSCRLGGIPNEYDTYIYYINELKAEDIARMVQKISLFSIEELEKIKEDQQKFVSSNKSNIQQSKNILKFVGIVNNKV